MASVIVWDVETVPDLRGFAKANKLDGKTDDKIREAIGDKFPKHVYHSIVCIGALVASDRGSRWDVEALGAPHVGDRTEKELISAFVSKIDELKPQLVTFNGSGFDLPVLRYRAMVNEVSARHCQTNLSGPAKGAGLRRSGRQLTPLGQGSRTVLFEDVAAVEVTVVVEVVVDRGMGGGKLLEGFHASEPLHRSFSSSEWLVRIFCAIVEPPTTLLIDGIADYSHRRSVRP